jgi:hypothetical protein
MYDLYRALGDEQCGLPGLAIKPRSIVSVGLVSKPVASGLSVWPSKLAATV